MEKGEIILYQPNETIKLEVRLEEESVWLTQAQIAALFGTEIPAISSIFEISTKVKNWNVKQLFPKWK